MSKLPDLGKLTDKIDFGSLLENVKTLVNPENKVPPGEAGDQIGQHLHEMSEITQRLAQTYAHQQRDLQKLASLMKAVYDGLHAEHPGGEVSKAPAPEATQVDSEVKPSEVEIKPSEPEVPKVDEPPKSE